MRVQKRKRIIPLLVMLLGFSLSLPQTTSQPIEEPKGNISFQPNVMPFVEVFARVGKNKTTNELNYTEGSGERFRFAWYNNTMDIELFFNATKEKKDVNETRLFSLKDFEDDFGVSVGYEVDKQERNCQFGWIIENVANVSDLVHDAWLKIEDTQPFDYEAIILEEFQVEVNTTTHELLDKPYNVTRFHLPSNLALSFEDLYHKGFIIGHQNKTSTCIKGFSGKSSWNLDPIAYSAPLMSYDGTGVDFWDLWNASNTNGWNVVEKNANNTQFTFACRLQGNATSTFIDTGKQVIFADNILSANWQVWWTLISGAKLRLGTLVSGTATRDGVSLYDGDTTYYCHLISVQGSAELKLYSCFISRVYSATKMTLLMLDNANTGHIYNCFFTSVIIQHGFSDQSAIAINNLQITDAPLAYGNEFTSSVTTVRTVEVETVVRGEYAESYTLRDFVIEGAATVFSSYYSHNCYLIDFTTNTWTMSLGTMLSNRHIYRQYSFTVNVTDSSGSPVQNANITVQHYGENAGQDFSVLTWANGTHATQTLTCTRSNTTSTYDYNPYNLTIAHASYGTYTKNFTLSEQLDWAIALTPTTGVTSAWVLSGVYIVALVAVSFLIFLGVVVIGKKRR